MPCFHQTQSVPLTLRVGYELAFMKHSVDSNGNICTDCSSYTGQLYGQRMVVQVTNKGGDLSKAHFDIQIPGGGFGIFNGCAANGADSTFST